MAETGDDAALLGADPVDAREQQPENEKYAEPVEPVRLAVAGRKAAAAEAFAALLQEIVERGDVSTRAGWPALAGWLSPGIARTAAVTAGAAAATATPRAPFVLVKDGAKTCAPPEKSVHEAFIGSLKRKNSGIRRGYAYPLQVMSERKETLMAALARVTVPGGADLVSEGRTQAPREIGRAWCGERVVQ